MSRKRILVLLVLALLVLLALGLFWLSRPQQLAALILDRAGHALGLEITATGVAEYQLRGTPTLVLRDVSARQPDAEAPMLQAERVLLALPWRTLRSKGAELTVDRLELDAPRLDLSALQAWLDARPPSDTPLRLPAFTRGLHVRDGHVDGDGWVLHALDLETRRFHPAEPLRATLGGDYLDAPTRARFDLQLELGQTQALLDGRGTPLRIEGRVLPKIGETMLPTTLTLSGPLRVASGAAEVEPMRFGASTQYQSGQTRLPFVLGMQGVLALDSRHLALAPNALVLHGKGDEGIIPDLLANGVLAFQWSPVADAPLHLALEGRFDAWPAGWPTLPPPVGQSDSPLPFSLRYTGALDASGPARLLLARDQTRFDASFHLPAVLDWLDAFATDTPLPPLDGRLSTPRLEVAGATLEGVEIQFDADEEP